MSRRRAAVRREINPDSKFNDVEVAKFINVLMYEGKKAVSEKLLYGAFDIIQSKHKMNPLDTFLAALENIRPLVQLKSVRVGGANHQVPDVCDAYQGKAKARKWLIHSMRARSERSSEEKLAAEIVDAFNKRGAAMKKREDNHKMAEANKAFAHYNPKKSSAA